MDDVFAMTASKSSGKKVLPTAGEPSLQTAFMRAGPTGFRGVVWDPADPHRKFVVELLIDGLAVDVALAEIFDATLARVGDGCHAFAFDVAANVLAEAGLVEARLANLRTPVGLPIRLAQDAGSSGPMPGVPPVQWLGGLRFVGALESKAGENGGRQMVKALVEGDVVAEACTDSWQNNGLLGSDAKALAAFNLYLPQRFADGCVHRVKFLDESGRPLPGSPVVFAAFTDGLAELIAAKGEIESERLRGEFFDRLLPMSQPFAHYAEWHKAAAERLRPKQEIAATAAVVVVGDGDEEGSLASLESQTHQNWVGLSLPYVDDAQSFDCNALRQFLQQDAGTCDFVVFARAGFLFEPESVARFAVAFAAHDKALVAYGDIALRDAQKHIWPIAFPAFDHERMLEQGYCCTVFAVRKKALGLLGHAETLNLYRLFNALTADPTLNHVLHLPGSLGVSAALNSKAAGRALLSASAAHLRDRNVRAKVHLQDSQLFPALRIMRQGEAARVSIIIPTRDRVDLLRACLDSIKPALRKQSAEIIVVDNESSDPATLSFLSGFEGPDRQVLRVPGAFNYSRLNNLAAESATGDYLCLLNNDVQALDSQWLAELLSRSVEEDVGAAGAMLIWPSGVVQHGGVVLGSSLGATHAFNDRLAQDPGYAEMLLVARQSSAVTAACLLTRRTDYLAVGGLDEALFPINFNDVDYCLKLRAKGKRIVFTPHARLLHLESASRGDHQAAHRKALFARELGNLRARWMDALVADPLYSPMLSLDPVPFSALAWPLRDLHPRWSTLPRPMAIPIGF